MLRPDSRMADARDCQIWTVVPVMTDLDLNFLYLSYRIDTL
jgi:hypothetical protein